ncbi:30S ribosomal protein S6e [Candidatus Pacearchaeota archaeon]|nr:30S ribosomal protein S6e [Candidatus Pacearchaeota archaeon]|tara:strand:- start:1310 stop:1720 length:411 start_codon:yes stop_codon:yes gene_type:complete
MVFKINIAGPGGKTFKVESENESLVGKKIGDVISGSEISGELAGYEFTISGTSDKAGFAGIKSESGPNLRKVMFTRGDFYKTVKNKGVRMKKNVRGNEVSLDTVQINVVVSKEGGKKLEDALSGAGKEEVVAEASA